MNTIFTAIFGNYEELKDPQVITPGWKYICFTDQPIKSKIWQIIQRPLLPEGPQRTARYYKILFHKHIESEFSIWVDASFIINCNLDEWWTRFKTPFTCIKHPVRQSVYKEIDACLRLGKDDVTLLRNQRRVYSFQNVPQNNGLIQSGILMRQKNHLVIDLCDIWYQQVQLYSARDQVAFAYASWRMPVHNVIEWDYRTGQEFIYMPHFHKRETINNA